LHVVGILFPHPMIYCYIRGTKPAQTYTLLITRFVLSL